LRVKVVWDVTPWFLVDTNVSERPAASLLKAEDLSSTMNMFSVMRIQAAGFLEALMPSKKNYGASNLSRLPTGITSSYTCINSLLVNGWN
jgi:hypothetical protein